MADKETATAELCRYLAEVQAKIEANRLREQGSPKACQLCRSIYHFGCLCPNLQQVFIANCYLADKDPFYIGDVYQEPAHTEEVSCEIAQEEEEVLEKEPEVVAHHFPPPPSPFRVKVIPDDLEQPSFLFKYGVLAKWHVKDEETDISTPPPPHTKCEEETKPFVYGGEEAKEEPSKKRKRSTKEESPTSDCSKSFGSMFASLRRCHPPRAQEDEWMEEFGVHSGRFKLLASPIY
jgi:hypothetical protein